VCTVRRENDVVAPAQSRVDKAEPLVKGDDGPAEVKVVCTLVQGNNPPLTSQLLPGKSLPLVKDANQVFRALRYRGKVVREGLAMP
jgi:hypothetical protein